jgi:RNA polymerase sigma-70 factor, ECF subfamily
VELVEAFASALPPEARAEVTPALGATLDRLVAEGQAAWPAIDLPAPAFVAYLAERVAVAALGEVAADDLYLACACARGDQTAIAALQTAYFGEIDAAGRRAGVDPSLAADARQNLAAVLFTGASPAILDYAGRGNLRGWLRVCAVREILRLAGKSRREVPLDSQSFLEALSPASDPELAFLKDHYRRDFAAAFHEAVAALSDRERALLHRQVVDGWTIDDFAAHHEIHRATAGRWLQAARATVLRETRERLKARWGGTTVEIESILRLLSSRLDLSVERALRGG